MTSLVKQENYIFRKLGLSGKSAGLVLLLGIFVLIPSILVGGFLNLGRTQNAFESYKQRVEVRIQEGLESVIWNYDTYSLREILSAELINDNLKSVRISTQEHDMIWLTFSNGQVIDEVNDVQGDYFERKHIPIYKLDNSKEIIAYATIWYDYSASREAFFQKLRYDLIFLSAILLLLASLYIVLSHNKLAKPLEVIRRGMLEAGSSSFDQAKKTMGIANFKWAFTEIKALHRDLENMFDEIEMASFKLSESETEFKAIFNQAGVGVAQVKAISAECVIANKKYGDILGIPSHELRKSSLKDLTYEKDKAEQDEIFHKLFSGEITELSMEKRYKRTDGTIVWVDLTISPLYKPGETPTSHIAVIQDITDKKIAEERLKKLNDELEDIVAERTLDLEDANAELEAAIEDLRSLQSQLINKEKMAVLGQLVAGIAHELNTPLGIIHSSGGTIERIIENEAKGVLEFNKKASEETFNVYKELVEKSIESIFYQDLSYKRKMRRKYFAINKEGLDVPDEIVEKLVEMGYHKDRDEYIKLVEKLENHTAIIHAYTTTTLYKSVQMITASTKRASKVMLALKTYSHTDTNLNKVHHDVVKDIEMVLTLFHNQTKYGVEIVRDYQEVAQVICIPDKLYQVWVNLFNNAIQAMDYKGVLKIGISQIGSKVKVSITDNGPGISDAIVDKIFDPFFSTKKLGEGTGLGLDIVKRILDEIDGSIDFETRPGETTFNVWLETQKE